MLNQAINICITGINAAFSFFDRIMSAIPGAFSFILAMIGVFTVFRLLLVPIMGIHIGGAGSDVARLMNKKPDEPDRPRRFTDYDRAVVAKQHASRIFGDK